MLTSKDHTDNIVKGLNLGADDYLTKPFTFTELVARIKAITRRKKTKKNNILVFHDLEINLNNQKVTRNGNVIDLAPKEFELLSLLAQNNKIVLSRHEILEKIWDIHFNMQKNLVEMQIKRLRSKIDDGFEKKLIKTVRGIGYMFDGG
jgi:two-component system copper resistance phosphate regulon response regulator CusR